MARPTAEWRFELVVSATMERLGELRQARDRNISVIHNRSGGASFTIPLNDDLFSEAEDIKHGIVAYRNDDPKWSGMIWNIDESIGGNRAGVQCVGWFEILNRRIMRQAVAYPRFTTPPTEITGGQIVFDDPVGTPGTTTYYPGGLLTVANSQKATWITEGTNTDQMKRIIAYERGQSIGQAIQALSDIEAGFDFTIDPLTRVMDIKNWNEYRDRRDRAVFGCNWGPKNMADVGRQLDASSMVNRLTAMGDYGGGLAEDIPSQDEFQLFEEMTQLSGVNDPNVLLGYAGGEIVLRSRPRVIYTLQPFPYKRLNTPEPFEDYDVGDKVVFSALKPPRIDVRGQAVRVFGIQVSVTNEGNEKLGALQVTPG